MVRVFRWFKRRNPKPGLSRVSDLDLYDVHNHVLPGLDDGAQNFDESNAMLDGLATLGYAQIAVTPHFDNQTLTPTVADMQQLISAIENQRNGRSPSVICGAEIVFDDVFATRCQKMPFPAIGQSSTYLVEFGKYPGSIPTSLEEISFQLRVRGVTMIIAHAERYPDFLRHSERIDTLRQGGALIQLDIMSIVGRYGSQIKRFALSLLQDRKVDLVASDIHAPRDIFYLSRALIELHRWDRAEFGRLASHNPHAVITGRLEEVDPGD